MPGRTDRPARVRSPATRSPARLPFSDGAITATTLLRALSLSGLFELADAAVFHPLEQRQGAERPNEAGIVADRVLPFVSFGCEHSDRDGIGVSPPQE